MTKKNELGELLATIERLRKEKYPELSENLVAQIIELEDQLLDERTLVRTRIEKLVDAELSEGRED